MTYDFTTSTTDPDTDQVQYQLDWGDGTQSDWSSLVPSGTQVQVSYAWATAGTYSVKARAKDEHGSTSAWSPGHQIVISSGGGNNPPDASVPAGPDSGCVDSSYSFSSSATDPDGDSVAIRFSWGDGNTSAWSDFMPSGSTVTMTKAWHTAGTYSVRAQAKDVHGATSTVSTGHRTVISGGGGNEPGTQKWVFPTGDEAWDAPAIGPDGTVYVSSDSLYAVNPDGTRKWALCPGDNPSFGPAVGLDGTIYVGFGNKLYAVNPDGSERWTYTTGGSCESPAIGSDGTIYVEGRALNPDGSERWVLYDYHTPVIGPDGTLYMIQRGADSLCAVNPNGTRKWAVSFGDVFGGALAIGSDGTIYVGSYNDALYAVNPDGTRKWAFPTGDVVYTCPAIGSDGAIYIGCEDSSLYAVNPDGTKRWMYPAGGPVYGPTLCSDGTIYAGSDGCLHAVKPDGTRRWAFPADGWVTAPAIGSDGTVYIGTSGHKLYAIYGSGVLAPSPWPRWGHDNRNTGRAGGP